MSVEIFEKSGLKNTRQRKAVLKVLQDHDDFLTAEQIYEMIYTVEKMSLSTVYRILTIFFEKNIVLKSIRTNGIAYFKLKHNEHKHLLTCVDCKESVEVDMCPLDELGQILSCKTGYEILGHNLQFTGICSKCRNLRVFNS